MMARCRRASWFRNFLSSFHCRLGFDLSTLVSIVGGPGTRDVLCVPSFYHVQSFRPFIEITTADLVELCEKIGHSCSVRLRGGELV